MGNIRNLSQVNQGINHWLKRVEDTAVAGYRSIVWEVFTRILQHTPQFSGKAVANWNIGIGKPDYSFDNSYGSDVLRIVGDRSWVEPHKKGDREWIDAAEARNLPKVHQITMGTKVFINNSVRGDTDKGRSSELYLESLQDPAYWTEKLRGANQPYEIAQQSVVIAMSSSSSALWRDNFMPGAT